VDPIFYPVIIFIAVGVLMIAVALHNMKKAGRGAVKRYVAVRSYRTTAGGPRYVQAQFSNQFEFDMRLPYRKFKHLYPESKWTYEEYKKMQMQTAFRRSFSSQDNKRMVR
jgi:hypothetical protein